MNILGILLLIGVLAYTIYIVSGLVKDIKQRKKDKQQNTDVEESVK